MKGRSNYLCLSRFEHFRAQPTLKFEGEGDHLDTVERWAGLTKTGDRAEITGLPETLDFWSRISARSENCVGRDCRDYDRCFITRMREKSKESEVVVVNHHLLFADLVVREGSYGEVLPDYDYLIIDEAHQIEDVATQYFGAAVTSYQVEELARDAEALWDERGSSLPAHRALGVLRQVSRDFFDSYRIGPERFRIGGQEEPREREGLYAELGRTLETVTADLKGMPNPSDATVALSRRAGEIAADLSWILAADDPGSVSWCELRERSVALRSSPVDVSEPTRRHLLDRKRAVVLTSATLAVESSFTYLRERLGVRAREEQALPSPFDFARQAVLYVPRHLPDPAHPGFAEAAAEEVLALIRASRGRAFVLFTSFANLHAVRRRIEGRSLFPLLVQGELPRSELLDRFRETPGAVLLASSSFWQGVDVAGDQLSMVIIDKLPFASPNDPLISARIAWTEHHGGSGFDDYQVPMAILALKQGLGRLIRTAVDRGALAILDGRLWRRGYGRRFLASLPPSPLTHDRGDVDRFFAEGTRR
jgi:ATP-dependent DNA helicase DinG